MYKWFGVTTQTQLQHNLHHNCSWVWHKNNFTKYSITNPTPPTHRISKSAISRLFHTRFWLNLKGRFPGLHLTGDNCQVKATFVLDTFFVLAAAWPWMYQFSHGLKPNHQTWTLNINFEPKLWTNALSIHFHKKYKALTKSRNPNFQQELRTD